MGLKKIYLDSCIVIYYIEHHPIYASKVVAEIGKAASDQFLFSPLVRMECLIKPLQNKDTQLQKLYEAFWAKPQLLDLPVDIFNRAAQIRADFPSLKTPDAIHLATVLHYGCNEFWTNDDRLANIAPQVARNILTT
jgi:uncharacterized protein